MAHTKESIAKMLATRKANRAAKLKTAKNGNGHGARVPAEALVLLAQVVRAMPSQPTALSERDLDILRVYRLLTRKPHEAHADA